MNGSIPGPGPGNPPEGLRGLIERTASWTRAHDGSGAHADESQVTAASTFARYCAPADATPRSLDVASRLLVGFLSIDDASAADLRSFVGGADRGESVRLPALLGAWRDEFEEMAEAPSRLADELDESLRDYLVARRQEVELAGSIDSIDHAWALRSRTIFTAPYFDHWLVSLRLDDDVFSSAEFRELRRLATELTFLFNDLGSVAFDEDADPSSSVGLVDVFRRVHGWSLERTVEHLVVVHDEIAVRYRMARTSMLASGSRRAAAALDLLSNVITDGNRRAHAKLLGSRYPAAAAALLRRLATP